MGKKIIIALMVIAIVGAAIFAAVKLIDKEPADSATEQEDLNYVPLDSDMPEDEESGDGDYNGISFSEEDDGYNLKKVKASPEMFVGSWISTSDRAVYYYGDVELTIKDNKTWKGTITGEELKGTWSFNGNTMHMNDVVLDFDFDLAFSSTGKLIMIERMEDGELHTVLIRK